MPAYPLYDDLKTVSVNLDGESRRQLVVLVRNDKSNNSAVIRRLIDRAYADFLRSQLHQSAELTTESPVDHAA